MCDVRTPRESRAIGRAGADTGQIAGVGASVGRVMKYDARAEAAIATNVAIHAQRSNTTVLIGDRLSLLAGATELRSCGLRAALPAVAEAPWDRHLARRATRQISRPGRGQVPP